MLAILGLFGVLMAGLAADAVISSSGDEADDSEDSPPEDAGAISDGDLLDDLAGDPTIPTSDDITDPGDEDVTVVGTEDADALDGRGGDDQIEGRDGADLINGRDGDDSIEAGSGNDAVWAGAGDDSIRAGFKSLLSLCVWMSKPSSSRSSRTLRAHSLIPPATSRRVPLSSTSPT